MHLTQRVPLFKVKPLKYSESFGEIVPIADATGRISYFKQQLLSTQEASEISRTSECSLRGGKKNGAKRQSFQPCNI